MRVLIACEYSGTVRDAFAEQGWDAWSCDLLPTDRPGKHIQGDVTAYLDQGWDLMIGHPPCTYLSNSGVCHLYNERKKSNGLNPQRWMLMEQAAEFFKLLYNTEIPHIAIENPIMHPYGKDIIGVEQSQVIQPYQFGHMEQKATCLWLKNLPCLVETSNVYKEMMELPKNIRQAKHYLPPSPDRWKLRSTTFSGIAEAMAKQWTESIKSERFDYAPALGSSAEDVKLLHARFR